MFPLHRRMGRRDLNSLNCCQRRGYGRRWSQTPRLGIRLNRQDEIRKQHKQLLSKQKQLATNQRDELFGIEVGAKGFEATATRIAAFGFS